MGSGMKLCQKHMQMIRPGGHCEKCLNEVEAAITAHVEAETVAKVVAWLRRPGRETSRTTEADAIEKGEWKK